MNLLQEKIIKFSKNSKIKAAKFQFLVSVEFSPQKAKTNLIDERQQNHRKRVACHKTA